MEKELDRADQRQAETLLPPDERPVMKWNGNPFVVDGGNGGVSEDDGGFFLLPYWMGRFLGPGARSVMAYHMKIVGQCWSVRQAGKLGENNAEFGSCAHGGGADVARRARVRYLFAPA